MQHNLWISPHGRIFKIGMYEHYIWVREYIRKKGYEIELEKIVDFMEEIGWLRVIDWGIANHPLMATQRKPNKMQEKALTNYPLENGKMIRMQVWSGYCFK